MVTETDTKTCRRCGREGVRGFDRTYAGWRCSHTEACARRVADQEAARQRREALQQFRAAFLTARTLRKHWRESVREADEAAAAANEVGVTFDEMGEAVGVDSTQVLRAAQRARRQQEEPA